MKYKNLLNLFKLSLGVVLISPFFVMTKNNENNIYQKKLTTSKNTIQKQTIDSITSFTDYDPIFSDANTPLTSNEFGTIGRSNDNGIIIMTSYNGSVSWMTDIRTIDIVKKYYANLNINDISNYTIKSSISINNKYLAVLFSDPSKNNSIVLALNLNDGTIYAPFYEINGEISYSKNIAKVSDGSAVLFESPYPQNSLYAFPDGKGADLKNKVHQVTITNRGISSLNILNDMLSENENDYFVGFISGHLSTIYCYALFLKHDTKEYYIKVFDNTLKEVKNNSLKLKFDTSIIFSPVVSGHITSESQIPKHGFRANGSTNETDKFIFVFYGENAKIKLCSFNGQTKSFQYKSEYTFSSNKPFRISRLNNSNELFYSIEKTTDNTIFGIVDMGQGNSSNNETISQDKKVKLGTESAQYSKPWKFVDIKNSTNKAYIFINTVSDNSKIKMEYNMSTMNGNLNFSNSVDLRFNKYTFNKEISKFKIASTITDEELKNALTYSNNNAKRNETLSIENKKTNNDNGLIEFNYRISYRNLWNNQQVSFSIPIKNNNSYKFSNFNFKFVTSQNINKTKFGKINELKTSKYADAITKQEILNHFVEYDIKDKDNNAFTLTESMITLTTSSNKDVLKVDINLLADSSASSKLPSGINSFSSYYKQSYSFAGFLSLNGYDYSIQEYTPSAISSKHPSEITFYDVINNIVTIGPSYSKALSDWTYEVESNDIEGTFTIKKLIYKKTVDANFPENKKNLITNNKVYSNFKTSVSLMDGEVRISNLDRTQTINKKPSEIWKEYQNALNDTNIHSVEKTLIYNSIQQNVVINKKDLILNVTNLDTADSEYKLKFNVKIKQDAVLIPKIKNQNLIFSNEFKTKLISSKPNYYPFTLTQNIELLSYQFDWNYSSEQKDGFELNDSKTELTINLDKTSWGNLSNKFTANEFVNSIDDYNEQIKNLFLFNENYEMKINDPILNSSNGMVWIRVDFLPKIRNIKFNSNTKNNALSTISKQIIIKGFKIPFSPIIKFIPFVAVILLTISMIVLSIYMFIRSSKKKTFSNNNFAKKIEEKKKTKYI